MTDQGQELAELRILCRGYERRWAIHQDRVNQLENEIMDAVNHLRMVLSADVHRDDVGRAQRFVTGWDARHRPVRRDAA